MDGTRWFATDSRKGVAMISPHLQFPTFLLITPILAWGVWLISEYSFDAWGMWINTKKMRQVLRVSHNQGGGETSDCRNQIPASNREQRTHSIFLNFAIGFSLVLLSYFLIFINPKMAAPILAMAASIAALIVHSQGKPKRDRAREKAEFEGELPTYMQLMTVLISSGISPARALDLLSRRSVSISGQRLQEVVSEIHHGSSVTQALDNLSHKYDALILRRFVTGIILAIERGSSLTPILIAQVKDARVVRKNQILQRAGRAEIALMIPVVFLILPISILFALWPSYQQLSAFI